jgi:hypothetical protein
MQPEQQQPERGAVDVEAIARWAHGAWITNVPGAYERRYDQALQHIYSLLDALAAAEAQRARLERALTEIQRTAKLASVSRRRARALEDIAATAHSALNRKPEWWERPLAPPRDSAARETSRSVAPNHTPECQVSRRYPWAAELSCTCAGPRSEEA